MITVLLTGLETKNGLIDSSRACVELRGFLDE
jgi:hypothetical protein